MFRVIVVKAQMYENYSVAQYLPLHFFISARAAEDFSTRCREKLKGSLAATLQLIIVS